MTKEFFTSLASVRCKTLNIFLHFYSNEKIIMASSKESTDKEWLSIKSWLPITLHTHTCCQFYIVDACNGFNDATFLTMRRRYWQNVVSCFETMQYIGLSGPLKSFKKIRVERKLWKMTKVRTQLIDKKDYFSGVANIEEDNAPTLSAAWDRYIDWQLSMFRTFVSTNLSLGHHVFKNWLRYACLKNKPTTMSHSIKNMCWSN